MAECSHCNREMTTSDGCTVDRFEDFGDGLARPRIPVADPRDFYDDGLPDAPPHNGRCRDCGAKAGHFHHPGCDRERCPRCEGQAIGCDCASEPEGQGDE